MFVLNTERESRTVTASVQFNKNKVNFYFPFVVKFLVSSSLQTWKLIGLLLLGNLRGDFTRSWVRFYFFQYLRSNPSHAFARTGCI